MFKTGPKFKMDYQVGLRNTGLGCYACISGLKFVGLGKRLVGLTVVRVEKTPSSSYLQTHKKVSIRVSLYSFGSGFLLTQNTFGFLRVKVSLICGFRVLRDRERALSSPLGFHHLHLQRRANISWLAWFQSTEGH